jgi:hypothetical protein
MSFRVDAFVQLTLVQVLSQLIFFSFDFSDNVVPRAGLVFVVAEVVDGRHVSFLIE